MNTAIEDLITDVIRREGGFVNDSVDRGGATNWGITIGTLRDWRGKAVSVEDVKNLTQNEAREIYRANYFRGLESITDPKCLAFLFDYSVNAGNKRAVQAVQNAIGTTADGAWGPKSQAALVAYGDQSKMYWKLVCYRFDHFMRIMGNDPSQTKFAHGWANRMKEFWS